MGALLFVFYQGKKLARIKSELVQEKVWSRSFEKATLALRELVDKQDEFREYMDRVHNASTPHDLDKLYNEIYGLHNRNS